MPVFYLQMDSEGEEQTLKACNGSAGEYGFFTKHTPSTHIFHLPPWIRGISSTIQLCNCQFYVLSYRSEEHCTTISLFRGE